MNYIFECFRFWNGGGIINWIIIVGSFFLFSQILQKNQKPFINSLINVFPPLGLLGTVAGMIQTFTLISSGNIDKISDGISVSLLTTLSGISISILGIFLMSLKK
jgi:biopolymer transport protein ExbB/TolQ